jgi:ubiquitin C-terminal hydrolase
MEGTAESIRGNLEILIGTLREYESIMSRAAFASSKDQETIYFRSISELTYKSVTLSRSERLCCLRKAIAQAYNMPHEFVHFDHGANSYSFLDDDRPLSSLNHALFFSVKAAGGNYKFVHIANAIGNNEVAVRKLFELLLDERFREQSWFILSRLTESEGIKNKVRSLGRDYTELMETDSIHNQLLCLKVLLEISIEEEFANVYTSTRGNELLCNIVAKYISLDEDLASHFHSYDPSLVSQFAEMHIRLLWKFSRRPSNFDLVISLTNISKCLCELLYLYAKSADADTEQQHTSLPNCVYCMLTLFAKRNEECMEVKQAIGSYHHLKELILAALIRPKHARFASEMSGFLLTISQAPFLIHEEIGSTVLNILESAVTEPEADPQFFYLASKLIQRSTHIAPESYFASLFAFLQSRSPEESSSAQDKGLTGALKMMRTLLKISPQLCTPAVAQYLLLTCLIDFNETQASQPQLPKCKSPPARLAAFKCLSKLVQQNAGICEMVLKELSVFFTNLAWRKAKLLHWNNYYSPQEKSNTGFVGLKNLGCTCYMNSLLQQLFQIPSFRFGLFQCDLQEAPNQVLYQLQKIATGLVASDKMFVHAKGLCQVYKNWEGQPINPLEQMDVEEFFNGLMDKVETELHGTNRQKLVEEHFKGIYTTQCIGKDTCSHRSERDESFLTLSLEIKNKSSILQSLEALTTGEVLEGDNAYACDFCSQKVTASRRICLRSLPNVLLLTLRRFDFDMDTMTRMKLNSYCEFPLSLDMEPYTIEGVLRKEQGGDLDERLGVLRAPEEYYQYGLRGIIIHLGSAEAGHYYSYIKTEEKGWVEFNDATVDTFDEANIPHEAFGVSPGMLGDASKEEVGKMKNAYMLIYERKVKYAVKGKDDALPEVLPSYAGVISPSTHRLLEHFTISNLKYWKIKRVFSPEFHSFVTKLSSFDTRNTLKFCLFYYLTINIRAKDRNVDFFDRLYERVSQSHDLAWWVLEALGYEPMLRELLIQCPVLEVRKCLIGLAERCVQVVPLELKEAFLIRLTEVLPRFPERVTKEQSSFFELLYRVSRLHYAAALRIKIPLRLMYSLLGRARELAPLPSLVPVDSDMHLGRELDLSDSKYPGASETSPYFTTFHVALLNDLLTQIDISEIPLLQDPHLVAILVRGAHGRFGGNQSGRLFCSFIENTPPLDDPVYTACVATLISELRSTEADYFKSPLLQLRQIVSISDEYQNLRVEQVMSMLTQVLVANLTYIRITEALVIFLYKLAQRVRPVRFWLQENTDCLVPLNVWRNRYATWSQQTPNSLQLTKTYSALNHLSDFRPSQSINSKANSLLSCKISERISSYDSDEDTYDAPLTRNCSVELVNKDESRYRVVVQHCYGPALYVKYEDYPAYPTLFVASDDDRLMDTDKMQG